MSCAVWLWNFVEQFPQHCRVVWPFWTTILFVIWLHILFVNLKLCQFNVFCCSCVERAFWRTILSVIWLYVVCKVKTCSVLVCPVLLKMACQNKFVCLSEINTITVCVIRLFTVSHVLGVLKRVTTRGVTTGVDIGIYTPKISPSNFMQRRSWPGGFRGPDPPSCPVGSVQNVIIRW